MDFSVIIVEYMDLEMLERAILSINTNISEVNKEVIVISNSSYPTRKQIEIQQNFLNTKFIFNKSNLGFAKAVNQAIMISSGKLIMLLNPDAKLLDNSFLRAVELMKKNKKIAVVGPMTLDGKGQLHDTFRGFMSPMALVSRTLKRFLNLESKLLSENRDFQKIQPVDWVSGGCLIVSKAAIEDSGLMDERYFMYIEDMDWCRRFWLNGYEVWYLPDWKVEHIGSKGSTKVFSITNKLMWIHLISYLKYYFKWKRLSLLLLSFIVFGKIFFY